MCRGMADEFKNEFCRIFSKESRPIVSLYDSTCGRGKLFHLQFSCPEDDKLFRQRMMIFNDMRF
jgi:hypothetical protein